MSQEDEFWDRLKVHTAARIGLGRVGEAIPTARLLAFKAAHAAARDAVHTDFDEPGLVRAFEAAGFDRPVTVASRASSRSEYLRRPDLGRVPADLTLVPRDGCDLSIVICDGLSARAVDLHAVAVARALRDELAGVATVGRPVVVARGRVAIGDHVARRQGARAVVVLIGERPGLSVSDGLGAYLTWDPAPGRADSDRNCVSNIRPPHGQSYGAAARTLAGLYVAAEHLGRSGVDLKDLSRETLEAPGPSIFLG